MIEKAKKTVIPDPDLDARKMKTLEHYELNLKKIKKINIKETFGFYK
jgi:hypothetical protein